MAREWPEGQSTSRVRVFIDHWEFSLSWQMAHSGFTGRGLTADDRKNAQLEAQEIRWDLLPEAILEHLDEIEYIEDSQKELRNVDVYASRKKSGNHAKDEEFVDWLEENVDPIPGFQVYHFDRNADKSDVQCRSCSAVLDRPELEKGMKTKMACDLLSCAVKDLFDIAVLFANDPELVPSVSCVQEVFDKKVIHVGLKDRGRAVRSAAWGHILLNDLMRDLFNPDDFKKRKRR